MAATSTPRLPPAPGRLSMTTVQLFLSANSWATVRAMKSVPPPGGKGTTRRMGLLGKAGWATAAVMGTAAAARPNRAAHRRADRERVEKAMELSP
ncbi:hypothetical protein D3C78_1383820 [compost metagenome]